MNSFLLPFLLTVAMAVPLLWYHLDGTDPLDIAVRPPSQAEIDFAKTREQIDNLGADLARQARQGPARQELTDSGDAVVIVDTAAPGY
ncbi:hypothetical protein [Denitrobaculum tricleocarpae]|uniref:Uncharacterized protein n=1 Tax=Denitrobaculum tricleocarpae TaxID=2591009 RepID=A0A545TP18_9PROT|nr:hypothetical protein [Denitrobaculum tricleocarpae]TQV78965.1 hypothetical protein FKG95_14865 [Denitrobaculum tricleocarpae]